MNAARSLARTWSESTHGIKRIIAPVSSRTSHLSRDFRSPILSSVRTRSGVARGVEIVVCCHNGLCFSCDLDRLQTKTVVWVGTRTARVTCKKTKLTIISHRESKASTPYTSSKGKLLCFTYQRLRNIAAVARVNALNDFADASVVYRRGCRLYGVGAKSNIQQRDSGRFVPLLPRKSVCRLLLRLHRQLGMRQSLPELLRSTPSWRRLENYVDRCDERFA
jgi:hypothetical protein